MRRRRRRRCRCRYLVDRGCRRVFSVDPGVLELTGPAGAAGSLPPAVRHLRMKSQEALPMIAAELGRGDDQQQQLVDVFVSDLVPHRKRELTEVVVSALEARLLRPGALLVLTFKGTKSRGFSEATWSEEVAEEAAPLMQYLEEGTVRVVHLMANKLHERTLIGFAK